MRRFAACLLVLAGCAAPKARQPVQGPPAAAHAWRTMIVYVPQTDDSAATWLKWYAKTPGLRLAIAMSPRFMHLAQDPVLRSQFMTLKKNGRLEIALQLPNAPILPLIVEDPPYGYADDLTQLIAQAKAGFYKTWGFLPQGLVIPYGAEDPKVISILERLGFNYIVAALGDPPGDSPFQAGSMAVWDGSPASPPIPLPKGEGGQRPGEAMTAVRVWDERQTKGRPLDHWILETGANSGTFILPTDSGRGSTSFNAGEHRNPRTWDGTDWSAWFGVPAKNAAWNALRRTREALEKYKNSGQASVQRLDVAFEEIYGEPNS